MPKDILQEIVAAKRIEVAMAKDLVHIDVLEKTVASLPCAPKRSMKEGLVSSSSGIIAEFKRRSPSKGWIHEDARPEDVVPAYAAGGASALSILTDMDYFGGCLEFIERVRPMVETPIMRKEFVIDPYQLFEARKAGADAVLLIAACLSKEECAGLNSLAHELGLETLLEIHGEKELDYCDIDASMIGVNNRNLGTFVTDVRNSFDIASRLPGDRVLVSESGLSDPATVRELREAGFRGFLMGEQFMKQADPGKALEEFISKI